VVKGLSLQLGTVVVHPSLSRDRSDGMNSRADLWTGVRYQTFNTRRAVRRTGRAPGLQTTMGGTDLSQLLTRCAAGDRGAFEQVYRLQSARLYGLALRITRQSSLASDAVQEALLQAWQNAGRFDAARGSAEAWLMGLVRYRALDIARRQTREGPREEMPERADESPDALSVLISSTDGAALARCLQELPAERQRLIFLAFTDGLSHSELSSVLGEPLGTVKSWIRRALSALRRCLAP
jgi:RNA polymerase sigma-70 factor (ECF subfamily)